MKKRHDTPLNTSGLSQTLRTAMKRPATAGIDFTMKKVRARHVVRTTPRKTSRNVKKRETTLPTDQTTDQPKTTGQYDDNTIPIDRQNNLPAPKEVIYRTYDTSTAHSTRLNNQPAPREKVIYRIYDRAEHTAVDNMLGVMDFITRGVILWWCDIQYILGDNVGNRFGYYCTYHPGGILQRCDNKGG